MSRSSRKRRHLAEAELAEENAALVREQRLRLQAQSQGGVLPKEPVMSQPTIAKAIQAWRRNRDREANQLP